MRIERVEGNRKIRVMLSQNDLLEMNINIRTLTPDSPELHSFLFRVMEYVKRETGFNAQSGQVVVEASPKDGGVVLTVTKVGKMKPTSRRDFKSVRAKKKEYPDSIYKFIGFEAMCSYLSMADDATLESMRLYSFEDGFFAVTAASDHMLVEFAVYINVIGASEKFLSEHGNLIAEGESLKNMACGIKNLQ